MTKKDFSTFLKTTERNLEQMDLYGDIMFVHDPQPVALIKKKRKIGKKWIWRCHIDLSTPNQQAWEFVRGYVEKYDASVFTSSAFAQELPIRQFLIQPSIDPLSEKNKELPKETISKISDKLGLDQKKPMITQVSRFDLLKDPLGVIDAYELVKKRRDCQLVLVGGEARDDPESQQVLAEVKERAKGDSDIHILVNLSDLETNAVQRASTVILQKSLKEGFGLTISEALWKGKPVIASAVGGIPLQVKHEFNGLLSRTVEGTAQWIKQLLNNPEYAKRLGRNAKKFARQNLLLTRHLKDHMLLFLSLDHKGDVVYL